MADDIPEWAERRALELAKLQGAGRGQAKTDGHYYSDMLNGFARYIAEHEEPPVDPLLIEARGLAAGPIGAKGFDAAAYEILYGQNDACADVQLALAALRRGMELAQERVS
jgi:hypothetical protein